MKKFFNLRKSKLLLTLLACIAGGVSPAWAETLTENFNGDLPEGWSIVGDLTQNSDRARSGKGLWTSSKSDNANYLVTEAVEGSITFYARAYNKNTNAYVFIYEYDGTALGATLYTSANMKTSSTPSFSSYTASLGDYKGQVAIALNYAAIDDVTYTQKEVVDGPALTVKDGNTKIISPYVFNFKITTAGTEKAFTLSNPGTESLGITVSETGNFGAKLSSSSIPAGGDATLTVTMPETSGSSTVTITPDAAGIEPFVINVSGTIRDTKKVYLDFADGNMPEGWTSVLTGSYNSYPWTASTGYISAKGTSSSYNVALTSPRLTFAKNEQVLFFTAKVSDASSYGSTYDCSLAIEYSLDGSTWTVIETYTDDVVGTWTQRNVTIPVEGVKYIRFNGYNIHLTDIYGGELPVEPKFDFEASNYDFGLISESTTSSEFTISNSGLADLTGVAVTSSNSAFTVSDVPTTIGAGESATFTVTMSAAATGSLKGVITVKADGFDSKSFNVSGAVLPAGYDVVDFNTAIPSSWENVGWTIENGAAKCTGKTNLTTQKLDFSSETSPFFVMKVKASDTGTGDYVTVEGSADNGATWTAFEKLTYSYPTDFGSVSGNYATIVVSIPNTVNKLRFNGYYVLIDEIDGLKYSANDPRMGIYTDAECTVAAATSVTKEFGFVTEAPDAATYYIKNDGTGTMTLTLGDVPAGFTASLDKNSVAAGEKATLTIAMPVADDGGYHGGNVVVTAEGLGTFTVATSGVAVEDGKLNLNFASDEMPTTWTANDWSKNSNGYIETNYGATTLQTSTLTATAGEKLVVVAKNYSTSSGTIAVKYKKVGSEGDFEDLIAATNVGTSWAIITGTIAEAGDYQLQFIANYYTQIQRIYGLSKPEAPEMVIYDGEAIAAATHSFGKVTDEEDATWTLTVKNEGKAALTGLAVALSGDNADDYTAVIADSKTQLAAGESATITVTQKAIVGTHSATLTISADGLDSKTIALSGNTVDHTILDIDFDGSNEWPAEVLAHDGWSVYNYNGSGEARQSSTSTASSLILTPMTVANESDKLTFEVAYYQSSSSRDMNVNYTLDGGLTWNAYNFGTEETPETSLKSMISSSYSKIELTNIPAGTVAFDFTGKSIKLDNITGDYKATTAPLVSFATTADNISGKNLTADATAEYTLQNYGNADYVATVAATGVTVAAAGEGVAFEGTTLTVPAGKTATITVTMAFAAPYGEKSGSLAITSESWVGDINVAYTAETVDPTNFVVDFDNNAQPAGWYSESWTYNTGAARVYTGTVKPMITELVGAESGKNTLTFDAQVASGAEDQTLNVYTSTDRKTWSEAQTFTLTADVQNFSLAALANGSYYVKFEAMNAIVDNIKGVKKLDAPAHDLYLVDTTWPTGAVTPGASYTATVKVASLRADEPVTAELYFGENKVATIEQTISNATTATLTLTGAAPAAGTYDVYVKVNGNVNLETEHQTVEVADTRILAITAFSRTSDAAVVADENNEFTATFSVTVENNGTATLKKDEVSVSLTDGTDVYEGVETTWDDETITELANGESATLTLAVTLTAEKTSYAFKVKENVSNTENFTTVNVTVTPYETIALNETETYDATTEAYGKVTLGRPFIAGWNTLVLPFAIDAETFAEKFGTDAKLYTFTSNNNGELTFTKANEEVKAGTPYLLKLGAAIGELTFEKVTVQPGTTPYKHDATSNGASFKGNYAAGFDMEGNYGVTPAGQVQMGAAGSTMKAFRAYITMPEGQQARIVIYDGTTGISRVLSSEEAESLGIFNLNGQRVSKTAKGVVIMNGKKMVVK